MDDVISDSAKQFVEEQLKATNHLNSQLADALAEVRHQKGDRCGQNNEEEETAQSLKERIQLFAVKWNWKAACFRICGSP